MQLLIIEDDPMLSNILKRDLSEKGFRVECVADGEEGLYKAENWPYDLIILDVMLPSMDGWMVLKRLRKKHQTPVLMLTAKDTVHDRIQGLDQGADDYLTKPFHFDELMARLNAIMRRVYNIRGAVLSAGGVELNMETKLVTLNGEFEPLTAREFHLLEILLTRKGKVVSGATLRDFLADPGEEVSPGTLDVHLHNLRKKFGKPFIKTIRGMGYTIEV